MAYTINDTVHSKDDNFSDADSTVWHGQKKKPIFRRSQAEKTQYLDRAYYAGQAEPAGTKNGQGGQEDKNEVDAYAKYQVSKNKKGVEDDVAEAQTKNLIAKL